MHTVFWFEDLKGRYQSEDLSVGGKILDLREIRCERVGWMHPAEDREE
jgi:hypothetical protein